MSEFHEPPLFEYPSAFLPGEQGQPSNVVDFDQLQPLVAQGAIRAQQHPHAPLTVFAYTGIHAQRVAPGEGGPHERIIDVCRGLIVNNETGQVVARPFERMTELGQWDELPEGPKTVYPKIDGTLGVQYQGPDGEQHLATRGSFDGAHAQIGTVMLQRHARENNFDPEITHLWEVVVPDGDYTISHPPGITLIGRIATATGIELPLPNQDEVGYPVVQQLEGEAYETAYSMRGLDNGTTEGFVVRMEDTQRRIKVKHLSYKWLTMERNEEIPGYLRDQVYKEGKQLRNIAKKAPHTVRPLVQRHADALQAEINEGFRPIAAKLGGADVELTPQQAAIYNLLLNTGHQEVLGRVLRKPKRRQARSERDARRRGEQQPG